MPENHLEEAESGRDQGGQTLCGRILLCPGKHARQDKVGNEPECDQEDTKCNREAWHAILRSSEGGRHRSPPSFPGLRRRTFFIDLTRTTTDLLDALHVTRDDIAWQTFDHRYRPILIGFARALGLSDADANDVAQETLARFLKDYREDKYDRARGRLKSWLLGIARMRIADVRRAAARRGPMAGGSMIGDLDDEKTLTELWEREERTAMLRDAFHELKTATKTKDVTIRAFELNVLREVPAAEVADTLGISRHEVYLAKNRIADRLKTILARIETIYDAE